ncbi:MAG: ring-cleaving dioxygenase [Anaerolineales bacterium]
MQLNGLHHVTAVSAKIENNVKFYTEVLGLRLVKKSVNQDDVSAYHLFYADKTGSPGTDMTFFDWPNIGSNVRGTNSIAGTAFRVPSREALDFWVERFNQYGLVHEGIQTFAGRELLPFEDPEGQRLYLVNDQGADFEGELWQRPEIPDAYLLRGFYSVVLSIPEIKQLANIFTGILNFEEIQRAEWIDGKTQAVIYTTTQGAGPGTEVWLLEQPEIGPSRVGAGGTHHVAFRVADTEIQKQWRAHLAGAGMHVTTLIDRFWFQSIYFRVSNGILFEIATDGPGFAIDEQPEKLGEKLVLPPFLEDRREEIEAGLKPIKV